ncbi:MAG: GAF domain-containing sensor histidine kinase [Trueperaceae bacterium]|nr:GAF domain-containing sensor histidine kinase [Trueperaceae bacterium]
MASSRPQRATTEAARYQQSSADAARSLYQQIKLARIWLPLLIIAVVLIHQLLVVPIGNEIWRFWSQLLFYSLLGPAITYITLDWIASEVRERERAQDELRRLYDELQASHALLGTIQKVTEQFATATDLEAVLSRASQGIAEATGATGCAVIIGQGQGQGMVHHYGLEPPLRDDAKDRDRALCRDDRNGNHHHVLADVADTALGTFWVQSFTLAWSDHFEGSLHAYYRALPSPEQRESFRILCSEFSAAAEATRSRTRDLLTLFEVDRSIRAEGNLEHLLETLLQQTMARTDARLGGVYLADEDGLLRLRAWRGLGATPLQTSLRPGEGFIGQTVAEGEARIADQLGPDQRRGPIIDTAQSALCLPLRTDEGLLGVIVLAHEQPRFFDDSQLPFLGLIAGQVSLAVRNARAYLQSEELAIAEERARIAREIHDGVAQSLAVSALKLDLISRLMAQPDTAQPDTAQFDMAQFNMAQRELELTKKTIRETIKEVRRSIFALRPVDLERHGFVETIRRYAHDYDQQNNVYVDLDVSAPPQLSMKSEAVLFRIFQEAMNNVAKHAAARNVVVRVGRDEAGRGFIVVEDDGRGFDVEQVSDRVSTAGGLGLKQMRERVQTRGGVFEIGSSPGHGTRVFAALPE